MFLDKSEKILITFVSYILWYVLLYIGYYSDPEVLLRVHSGICGTDGHIHDGEFISKFPVSEYRE